MHLASTSKTRRPRSALPAHRLCQRTWRRQTADVGNHLPDLIGGELSEGRHCGASNAGANVLENLAIGISVRQSAAAQGWSTVASASLASMTSLARRIVDLAAGVVRIRHRRRDSSAPRERLAAPSGTGNSTTDPQASIGYSANVILYASHQSREAADFIELGTLERSPQACYRNSRRSCQTFRVFKCLRNCSNQVTRGYDTCQP